MILKRPCFTAERWSTPKPSIENWTLWSACRRALEHRWVPDWIPKGQCFTFNHTNELLKEDFFLRGIYVISFFIAPVRFEIWRCSKKSWNDRPTRSRSFSENWRFVGCVWRVSYSISIKGSIYKLFSFAANFNIDINHVQVVRNHALPWLNFR